MKTKKKKVAKKKSAPKTKKGNPALKKALVKKAEKSVDGDLIKAMLKSGRLEII